MLKTFYKYFLYLICFFSFLINIFAWKENIHGSIESGFGKRTVNDEFQEDNSLAEVRLQLDYTSYIAGADLKIKTDFIFDDIIENTDTDLETGKGWIDVRETNLLFYPLEFLDLKIGRQILTWGTGDLIFINDLFPKDWQSFFNGRNEEYLKAPSDALKFSFFTDVFNFDLIYTPQFDQDRFIDGSRLSYYSPFKNDFAGRNSLIEPYYPDEYFKDNEIALRFYKNFKGIEAAFYFYQGFWKTPEGIDSITLKAYYPEMNAYGLSIRSSFLKGLINFETGYYDSKEDSRGDDPFIRNSETRILLAYEQEILKELTMSVQFYAEIMSDYKNYKQSFFNQNILKDEIRKLITLRFTKMLLQQNLRLSLFTFFSPSDSDYYFRPKIFYKISDYLSIETGSNIFGGTDDHTFFSQFQNNNNIYCRIKYAF